MGQAKITGGGPTGLYNVEIVKHAGRSAARLAAIAVRLTALTPLINVATAAVAAAVAALAAAQAALDSLVVQYQAGIATREQVTTATTAVTSAQATLTQKRRALSVLNLEKTALEKEQTRLQAAMAVESRTGIWCTDLTEDLAVGATVGTMEMNGVDDEIILTPGGSVSKSIGLLQHAGVSTPAAVFCNLARLPGWQKWKPNYRVGTLTEIDYTANTCSVGIEAQYSEAQGLPINQTGEAYTAIKTAVQGWADFAARNPSFALVTNTASTNLTMTPQLLADLEAVQSEVNDRNKYKTDTQQFGKLERWALMSEGGSGDCEDFALTKAQKLLQKGYAASALHIEIGTRPDGQLHAWLVVQTDKGDYGLDLNYKGIVSNNATPYRDRQRQTGMVWSRPGVLLEDVPIEYMTDAGSSVFETGDEVVVQFVGQSWTSPKVIGFRDHPRGPYNVVVSQVGNSGPVIKVFRSTGELKYTINAAATFPGYTSRGVAESDGVIFVALRDQYYDPGVGGMYGGDNALCVHKIAQYNLANGSFIRSFNLPYHPDYSGPAYDGIHGEWGNRRLCPTGIAAMKVNGIRYVYVADVGTAGGFFYEGDYYPSVGIGIWLFNETGTALAYIAGYGSGGVGDPHLSYPEGVHYHGGRVYVTHGLGQMVKSYNANLSLTDVRYFLLHEAPVWVQGCKGCAVLGSGENARLVAAGDLSLVYPGTEKYMKTFDLYGNLIATRSISELVVAIDAVNADQYIAYDWIDLKMHYNNVVGTAPASKDFGLNDLLETYIAVTGRHNET